MYQSVCLISEERNECVIATEVSAGLACPSSMALPAFWGWGSGLGTLDLRGHSGVGQNPSLAGQVQWLLGPC